VTGSKINIIYPISLSWEDSEVQEKARKIVVKTLKVESSRLIERLYLLSDTSGIKYKNADTRVLKTRWGSCNSEHEIVLNIYLIQLPWELIDYVIMHELTHTKFLNHSADFWKELEKYLPNYKTCQKEIKKFQPFGKVDEKSLGL
jgi:predicted metal-dependent hydrolase